MEEDEESGTGGAEQAFQDLRAEVRILRQAVEALPEAFKKSRPADTTETLGAIVKNLESLGQHLAAMEKHPALKVTPQQHANAIAVAGNALMHEAAHKLDHATLEAVKERRELAALIGSMRGRQQQRTWLAWTGVAALLLGLLLSPALARFLPFGLDGQVAAFILRADRWHAGGALMQAQSPEAWRDLELAAEMLRANQAVLELCREAAAKTKKEQRCMLVVPAP